MEVVSKKTTAETQQPLRTFAKRQRRMSSIDVQQRTAPTEPAKQPEAHHVGEEEEVKHEDELPILNKEVAPERPSVPLDVINFFKQLDAEKLLEEEDDENNDKFKSATKTPVTTGGAFLEVQRTK